MKRVLLASVAVISLFAIADVANAQNPNQMNQGSAAQDKGKPDAPAGAKGPAAQAPDSKMKAESPKPGSMAQDKAAPAAPKAQTTGQDMKGAPANAPKQAEQKPDAKAPGKTSTEMKADTKSSASGSASGSATKPSATTDTKPSNNTATDTKPSTNTATDTKSPASSPSATTGAAPASGAAAAPPPEKRAQIVSVIKTEKVEPVTNVTFNISVGTRVPSTVRYYPLPSRVVDIYPEWRGYYFILVNGRYVVLRPQTYEIVYIIEG